MLSSLTNFNAIKAVQNVEKKDILDTTGAVFNNVKEVNRYENVDKDSGEFKNVLNTITDKKLRVIEKTVKLKSEDKNTDVETEEIKEELEEKIEKLNNEDLMQCLNLIINFLNQKMQENESIQLNYLSDELKSNIMEILNGLDLNNGLLLDNIMNNNNFEASNESLSNLLNILNNLESLEETDVDLLKFTEKLLSEMNERIGKDAASNSNLSQLLNETANKMKELLNNTRNNELSLENNSLNNIYKVLNQSDTNADTSAEDNYTSSESRDEKILQSILAEGDSDVSTPVFTTTTTVINNSTGTVVQTQQTVNVKTMATDVVQNVKYMANNDMREMIVKVNPGNLGEITIRLIEEGGSMKLQMKAVSKETYNLLVQNSSEIKNQLSDQNIKIHDVNISLYEEDTTFFKEGEFSKSFEEQKGSKGNNGRNTAQGIIENEEELEDDINDSNAVNMLV